MPLNPKVTMPGKTKQNERPVHESRDLHAFREVEAELAALPESKAQMINVEITAAVIMIEGCLPHILALRAQMAKLPDFDLSKGDKLETYALAMRYAHMHFKATSLPGEDLPPLIESLEKTRDLLLSDALNLAKHGLLDRTRLKGLPGAAQPRRGRPAAKHLGSDVMLLVALMRDHWSEIQGRTAVPFADIDKAESLAERFIQAFAVRSRANPARSDENNMRRRAFTLFINAYQEVRRGVAYLRFHHGDADGIAPSLFVGRGGTGKKAHQKQKQTSAPTDAQVEATHAASESPSGQSGSSDAS